MPLGISRETYTDTEDSKSSRGMTFDMLQTIDETQNKIEQIKKLKKSLLNDLLTGKVRVKVN